MAKGAIAKVEVTKKIAQAFGADYIGEVDKKLYVWANENGERVQIAITMTCPKVQIDVADIGYSDEPGGDWDFSDPVVAPAAPAKPAEITQEEADRVAALMEKLGL